MKLDLADPELCRKCHVPGRVIDSRKSIGFRRRRHRCPNCTRRWSSWQMRLNPRHIKFAASVPAGTPLPK